MIASGIADLGAPGLLYWLRTGLPVCCSIAAASKNSSAEGVATTCTVQPRSCASLTNVLISVAGPAPQTMPDRTRLVGRSVTSNSNPVGEIRSLAPDARRCGGNQISD